MSIHILHVVKELPPAETKYLSDIHDDECRAAAADRKVRAALANLDLEGSHISTRVGVPGESIVAYAKEHEVGLIILPSRRRKGVKGLLTRSVAERIVRLAEWPVLALKGKRYQNGQSEGALPSVLPLVSN